MKVAIGIDCSARSTGVVILDSDLSGQTLLIQPKKLRGPERLKYIYDALGEFAEERIIDLAVIEDPSFKSTNRPFTLGEVHGVVKLIFALSGVPLVGVAPKALKKYGYGKGTASKAQMIVAASKAGCTSSQDDICDAWMLAQLGIDILEGTNGPGMRASYEVITSLGCDLLGVPQSQSC